MRAKCVPFMLELNCYQWFGDNKEKKNNMSSSHVLHATRKQIIPSRLLEENGREMYLIEKCTYKTCKTARFHR